MPLVCQCARAASDGSPTCPRIMRMPDRRNPWRCAVASRGSPPPLRARPNALLQFDGPLACRKARVATGVSLTCPSAMVPPPPLIAPAVGSRRLSCTDLSGKQGSGPTGVSARDGSRPSSMLGQEALCSASALPMYEETFCTAVATGPRLVLRNGKQVFHPLLQPRRAHPTWMCPSVALMDKHVQVH